MCDCPCICCQNPYYLQLEPCICSCSCCANIFHMCSARRIPIKTLKLLLLAILILVFLVVYTKKRNVMPMLII